MAVRWLTAFLDAPPDRAAVSETFWLAATATTLSPRRGTDRECATLCPPVGDPFLRVQVVGDGPARVHLDVHVDDVPTDLARARRSGARQIGHGDGYVVLRSPGGFTFCLVPHDGEAHRPTPVGERGARSLVDQLSIDAPPAAFDSEAAFWSTLTGWERRPGRLPEFEYLDRPAAMPLRLLLQRLEPPSAGPVRGHLDVACDDVDAEVARHRRLGAEPVRRTPFWATMRDPAGREYCLTARDPASGTLAAAAAT